jgi:site-specific DNA-methyltransferase (adenine-specific)
MADIAACSSSERFDWGTPYDFFERLRRRFDLTVDVCATAANAVLPRFWSPEEDALSFAWIMERGFMNPPYGREIGRWTSHAAQQQTSLVCGLLPSRTDTAWWHNHVMTQADLVLLVRGRLRFVGASAGAPFPSAVVVWDVGRPRRHKGVGPRFGTMEART